jgi:Protein of unknown function (DUF1552)
MRADNKVRWFSRRAFLGGAVGATIALPAMHSLLPRHLWAQDIVAPKRFLQWYFPCGVPAIGDWKPSAGGANWELSKLLSGLAPVKQHVSVLSGLRNVGRGPDHTYGTGAFLTGRYINEGNETMGGPSIDQVVADGLQQAGGGAPVHSMQLGVQDSVCENIVCFPLNNISYNNGGNPIAKQTNPNDAFDGLFSGFDPGGDAEAAAAAAERRALQKSVLDASLADANRLRPSLSATDRLRLDEYLASIRTTEMNLGNLAGATISCEPPDGVEDGGDIDSIINGHIEVMALAFECDLTRVISFMAASGATGKSRDYPNYHLDITHRADGDWRNKFEQTVIWEVEKFAALVNRLSTKTEADGVTPIIDNSALFFSSEISDGNNHNHDDMPVLLAGGLGGAITQGMHSEFSDDVYFADLYMYIAESMGVSLNSFGENGEGRITEL